MLPLLAAVLAVAAPAGDWADVAVEVSGIDGHRARCDDHARRLARYCGASPFACSWGQALAGTLEDPLAVGASLPPPAAAPMRRSPA